MSCFRDCKVQGFQGIRISGFRHYVFFGMLGFRISGLRDFRVGFWGLAFQGFWFSGFRGCRASFFWVEVFLQFRFFRVSGFWVSQKFRVFRVVGVFLGFRDFRVQGFQGSGSLGFRGLILRVNTVQAILPDVARAKRGGWVRTLSCDPRVENNQEGLGILWFRNVRVQGKRVLAIVQA